MNRISFALFLLISSQPLHTQTPQPDSLQTRRLAAMCQLWGHAHFFHPWLAYRDELPFDSAFAAAVPKVIAAPDAQTYAQALGDWLAVLGDPATEVEPPKNSAQTEAPKTGRFSEGEHHPLARFEADSTLVVSLRNYHDLEDWNAATAKFRKIAQMLPGAKALLFDLRSEAPAAEYSWYFENAFSQSGFQNMLSDKPLVAPGNRTRMHDGFASETGNSSGGYTSGFSAGDGRRIAPGRGARALPTVFLLNENSFVPAVALGLQAAGRGGIVAQGKVSDAGLAGSVGVDMGEGIRVQLRTGELLASDGTVGLSLNLELPAETPDAAALQTAMDFLKKKDFRPAAAQQKPPMVAAPAAPNYPGGRYPDLGWRVLGAAKVWAVIHYFFAYKDLMTQDWNATLDEFLPKVVAARDSQDYVLTVAEMYTRIEDGHGFVNSRALWDYFGEGQPPVVVRMIENQPLITVLAVDSVAQALGLEVGDVITHVGEERASARLDRLEKYISAANPNWRRYVAASRYLLSSPDGSTGAVRLRGKDGREKSVVMPRKRAWAQKVWERDNERHETEVIRILPGNIGYADLERLGQEQVDTMFEQLKNTKAIIFDMRGYPRGTAWSIAPRLSQKDGTSAALFQRYVALVPDIPSPDGNTLTNYTKHSFYQPIPPAGDRWKYRGKTLMLIDERAMSQSEHSGLFYETANGTEFVGSQTAGSNGDVTVFTIPGKINLGFSGHDVRHADGRQLQKTGLVPKIEVRPTIEGIRAGRDEVLERAIRYLEKGN